MRRGNIYAVFSSTGSTPMVFKTACIINYRGLKADGFCFGMKKILFIPNSSRALKRAGFSLA
jgi:hypothetical protein